MNSLAQWLAHCERLHPQNMALGLERVQEVVKRMDLRFGCPVVTVAGTNGKGSTCAMLEACLLQAGYRTGVYTSPHLVHFEERCRLQGDAVSESDLLPHFARIEAARTQSPALELTYFEFTTLAILSLMAESRLDVAILEVGLGGRLDAVNIIDTDCAVITSIDVDHMEFLGADRESWLAHDATALVSKNGAIFSEILVDQGLDDQFYEQLHPEKFKQACLKAGQPLTLRQHAGYDHGYYFIQTFMDEHLQFHAIQLEKVTSAS